MKFTRKAQLKIWGLALLVVVGTAAAAYATGGEGHGGGGIPASKWWDLLYRVLNFAGLLAILIFTLKKPIANGLKGRKQAIREQFEELEARRSEAEQLYREYEVKLREIDAEVEKIIEAAKAQGEVEKQKIITTAERTAGDIQRQAEMAIAGELATARRRLRDEVVDQAVQQAQALIAKNLQADDQLKLVQAYLDKVGEAA